ncbi:MAG TPA: extracellular solute-binding protein, partial [Phototrophicaceae bacterium]|nr:extracellular solute-binding protein [Phototrophicaceae bacterium]
YYQGHYYGLPLDTNTRVLLYSPDNLKAAGIDAPPATIDDVKADCTKVAALNNGSYLFSDGGTSGWNVLPWIWSMGGDITDANYTKASGYLNGAKTVAAYEFLKQMVDSGCFSGAYTDTSFDTGAGFFGGTILTELDGPWAFPGAQAQYPDFKLTPALMPAGDGGSISVVGGENIVMFNTTPNQAAALKFLEFTQSQDYQLKMSTIGQLTVQPALVATDYFKNHPYYPTYLEQLKTAKPRTPVPQWNAMEQILTDAGQSILRGESSAQDALDSAAQQIDQLLATQATQEPIPTGAPVTPEAAATASS